MSNYKDGIDFVVVSYCKHDYVRLMVLSIMKFFKEVPFTIYVVVNYLNKNEIALHKEMFKDNDKVVVLEGVDQSATTTHGRQGEFMQRVPDTVGLIDSCSVAAGSHYGTTGNNIGILSGTRKYVCVVDQDAIFLDKCADELMKLADKYFFISNRWDPGSIFKGLIRKGTCNGTWADGIARVMLFFSKRDIYDEIQSENYVERGIWRDSPWNCDYRDNAGNMTWYARQKGYDFLILKNSYRDDFRRDNNLWREHVLDIQHPYSEQCWIDNKPIFFHHGRGGGRRLEYLKNEWIPKAEEHLDSKVKFMLEKNSKVIFEDESNFAASEVARNFIQNRKTKCKIKGIGSYFPNKIVTNNDLITNTTDEWIRDRLGIHQRHIVDGELSSDLGYQSSLIALRNAKLDINDIDLIVTVTSSPDRISPSTACIIQDKLNPTKPIPAFDLNAVCSGFLYTMELVTPLLNKYENILVISTETYSRWTDWDDRNSVFFGDGSASVVLQKSNTGWYSGDIFADGKGKENFTIKHGDTMFKMNGTEVYKVGTKVLPQSIEDVLRKLDMDISEIDYFIPHQPSYKILFKTADIIGLPKSKIMMNMDKRGNTAGASIPTVLSDLVGNNVLRDGDKLLFAAVGSGWTWGAGVMSWEN